MDNLQKALNWWSKLSLTRKQEYADSIGIPLRFINASHIQELYNTKS